MKLISVIIPAYNHAHTLRLCLNTILHQTYRPIEVIIVNDGSTDNFDEVIAKIQADKKYQNLHLQVLSQQNKGAPAARNLGFKSAKGEYVIFWDADTIAGPEMLAKMVKVLENHPDNSYVYCDYKFGWKKMTSRAFDSGALKNNNYIDTTSLIHAQDFCGFDESLKRFQDWDLWLTLLEKNKTGVYLPGCLFVKIVRGRKGYSQWLSKIFFKLPWKTKKVTEFEVARGIVLKKHNIWI